MAKQKTPPPPPTAAPWLAAPEPQEAAGGSDDNGSGLRSSTSFDLEEFLDQATRPNSQLNEESVTPTRVVPHEVYPAEEPLDAAANRTLAPLDDVENPDADDDGFELPLPLAEKDAQAASLHAGHPHSPALTDPGASTPAPVVAESGWRRWIFVASGRTIRIGDGAASLTAQLDAARAQLDAARNEARAAKQVAAAAAGVISRLEADLDAAHGRADTERERAHLVRDEAAAARIELGEARAQAAALRELVDELRAERAAAASAREGSG